MKKILLLITFMIQLSMFGKAQDIKIDFPKGTIILEEFANLNIEAYDGTEVLIYEHLQENYNPDQAKGLQKINARAKKDNPGIKYKVRGEKLTISEPYPWGSFVIKVPKNVNLICKAEKLHRTGGSNKNYKISKLAGEIEIFVMEMLNVELVDITGSASVTTHGNISATFKSIPKAGALSFDTYRGFVDVSLPGTAAVSVNATAKAGDVFTDFNFVKTTKGKNPETLSGTIGGGGTKLILHTETAGNIYIRKAK